MKMKISHFKSITCGIFSVVALFGGVAQAQSQTWSGATGTQTWLTPSNWNGGTGPAPGALGTTTNGDIATFNTPSTGTSVTIDPTRNIGGIVFDGSAGTYTIGSEGANGGNALALSSGGSIVLGTTATSFTGTGITETIDAPLLLEPVSSTTTGVYSFINNSSTASDVLDFTGNISRGGTGSTTVILTLGGTNTGNNTISGFISNGTGKLAVTKTGSGTWILSGANSFSGGLTVSGGTLVALGTNMGVLGSAGATLANGTTLDLQSASGSNVTYALGGAGSNFNIASGGSATIISDLSSGSVGNTYSLNARLTFGGATGTVNIMGGASVTSGVAGITFTNALDNNQTGGVTINSINPDNGGTTLVSIGAFDVKGAGAHSITFGGNGNSAITGILASSSGPAIITLIKSGTGTLTLSAANAYATTDIIGGTVSVSADNNLGTVPSTATPGNIIINGGTLAITTGFTLNSNRGIALGATTGTATGTINVASGQTVLYGGILANNGSGSGSLDLSGSGTLILSGASTYSGTTEIDGGTLQLGNGDVTGSLLGSGNILDNSFLVIDRSNNITQGTDFGVISGSGNFAQTGSGTTTLSSTNTYTGSTTVSAGTLVVGATNAVGSSSSVVVSGGEFALGSFNDTVAGIQLTGGTISSTTGILTSASNYDLQSGIVSAILSGNVGLNKTTGGTVILSGANTYTGATVISAGLLSMANGATTGTLGTGDLTVNGTLDLESSTQAVGALNGSGVITNLYTNGRVFNSALIIGNGDDSGSFSGSIMDGGVNGNEAFTSLTKVGAGTQVLSGESQYSGGTTINGGILSISSEDNLGNAGGYFANFPDITPTITLGGGELLTTATTSLVEGVSLNGGTINTLAASAGTTATYNGAISASGSLTVGDSLGHTGTVALTQANTYTGGTHVVAGTLLVDNTTGSATGFGGVTVDSGATLAGTGTINATAGGGVNVINGNVLVGHNSLTDVNTVNVLHMTASTSTTFAGANLTFNLDTTSRNSNTLDLGSTAHVLFSGGNTLTFNLEGGETISDTTRYTLFTDPAGSSAFSDISGMTLVFDINGVATSAYNGSFLVLDGNNLELEVMAGSVPEPGTWALMLGGFAFLILIQYRRRNRNQN